jgi:myo-inositol catabolism protein IolC
VVRRQRRRSRAHPESKGVVADAFLLARERSAEVRAHGALLMDEQYAGARIASARAAGVRVGVPAEWPGSFPLRWATEPMERALTGTFVKVLVRHRPDYAPEVVDGQLRHLVSLPPGAAPTASRWCSRWWCQGLPSPRTSSRPSGAHRSSPPS